MIIPASKDKNYIPCSQLFVPPVYQFVLSPQVRASAFVATLLARCSLFSAAGRELADAQSVPCHAVATCGILGEGKNPQECGNPRVKPCWGVGQNWDMKCGNFAKAQKGVWRWHWGKNGDIENRGETLGLKGPKVWGRSPGGQWANMSWEGVAQRKKFGRAGPQAVRGEQQGGAEQMFEGKVQLNCLIVGTNE
uniref:Uncharacterized protein n=1 Tax=Globodera rostochiensis TaxID=31243 RepID=A0A914I155_GLORO